MTQWLNNLPFKFRIFFGCLLVAFVPLFFSTFLLVRIFDASLNRQTVLEGQKQLDDVSLKLGQLFDNCERACENLTGDGSAAWVMIDNTTVQIQKDLYLSLYEAVQEVYSYAEFNIYDAGGKLRFSTDSTVRDNQLPVRWGLLRKASHSQGLSFYGTDTYLYPAAGCLMQAAYSLESPEGARMGYVVLDFDKSSFDRLLTGFYSDRDTLLLLDPYLHPVYCSRSEYDEKAVTRIIGSAFSTGGQADQKDSRFQYIWAREPSSGYYILLQRGAQVSTPAIRTMQTISLALAVVSLILCLIISLLLSRSISHPVSRLDKAMELVKGGDLSIRIFTTRKDELGRLSESFNRMTADLKLYVESTVQKQKDLNDTTLKLYQTQLNPHFLYNTLDTIKWSAKIRQIPEIAILAENLAVILRSSISSRPFIPLSKELETIDNYIQIQKIRFSGRFHYETEIPDQLGACLVPKMILQPLVENAIIHGLDGCEHGYICIYAVQENAVLSISVTDDGCGMSAEMEEWINSDNPEKREGHLGLYNVINILKIYYGPEYGVRASVIPDEGTTVTITLPAGKERPHV